MLSLSLFLSLVRVLSGLDRINGAVWEVVSAFMETCSVPCHDALNTVVRLP